MDIDFEKEEVAARLKGSLLEFTKLFFKEATGRDFIVSAPLGRESHHITVCRELARLARLEIPAHRLIINIPPGFGKSTFVCMWIAWCWASFPDSQFLYISYSQTLAAKHTAFIKQIVSTKLYGYLFDVFLRKDSRAKDAFQTLEGGSVKAFGSGGAITGQDAGLPGLDRFSGAFIIDDPIKPDDAFSDLMRGNIQENYKNTIRTRVRGINVPGLFIGQRLHEDDLAAFLLNGMDIEVWHPLVLKALDEANNSLYPEIIPHDVLLEMLKKSPYVASAQYQQNPIPAGGALFKPEDFVLLDNEPKIVKTFITADTAETTETYNDATVFSFFGIYEIEALGRKTGEIGLHWLDCIELRIEPKELEGEFLDFWQNCMAYKIPPTLAAIEKKSTGVTLLSVLKNIRGIQLRNIDRTKASGNKGSRYIDMQRYIASKLISLPTRGVHTSLCVKHMQKITANDSHRFDDICDTLYDAIKMVMIDKTLTIDNTDESKESFLSHELRRKYSDQHKLNQLRYGSKHGPF